MSESSALLTSSALAALLPQPPVLSSPVDGWKETALQRHRGLPEEINLPGFKDEVLVGHQEGPFIAETGGGTAPFERRWIGPGQITINPSGLPVHRVLKGKPDVVLLYLGSTTLRSVAEEMFDVEASAVTLIPKMGTPDEAADRLIRLLLAEAEAPMSGASLMVETLTRALMVHLLRKHSNLGAQAPDLPSAMSPKRVRRVVDYMRANIGETLSLTDLSQVGGLSPSRFVRAFHKVTGQPPYRFLLELRIAKARQLLEKSDLPLIEVGLRCGFPQPSHFATTFRKMTGFTPSSWRREHRG